MKEAENEKRRKEVVERKEEEAGFDHLCWDAALIGNTILFNFSQGLLARQRP